MNTTTISWPEGGSQPGKAAEDSGLPCEVRAPNSAVVEVQEETIHPVFTKAAKHSVQLL